MEGCGGEWFGVPVPRFFLCVGALHPIRRQCTSSVRVHRHITGAAPRNGCSASDSSPAHQSTRNGDEGQLRLREVDHVPSPHATVTKQSFPLCGAVTSAHSDHIFTCSKGWCVTLSTIPGTAHRAGLAARHFRTNPPP